MKISLLGLKVAPIQTEGNKKPPGVWHVWMRKVGRKCQGRYYLVVFGAWNQCFIILSLFLEIDECKSKTHNCNKNALCKNTEGSFTCTCNRGYKGDGKKCRGIYLALFKGGFPPSRNFYVRRRFSFKYVYKIRAMYQRLRVNVKLEPRSTFTRGLSYIASRALTTSIIFTRVHFTCVRTWISRGSGNPP